MNRPGDARLTLGIATLALLSGFALLILSGVLSPWAPEGDIRAPQLAGVLLAGLGFTLAVIQRPSLLVVFSLLGVVLDQWESLDLIGLPQLTLTKLLALLGGTVLVARILVGRENRPFLFPAPALAHLPFSLVCVISTLAFAYSPRGALRWLIAPVFLPLFAILLTQFVNERREALRLLKVFVVLSFFPMGVAFFEALRGRSLTGPIELGVTNLFRVAGNFENPNDFVVLMLFSIPVLLLWGVHSQSLGAKLLLFGGAFFQGLLLLKTYSRSGYVSMAFAIASIAFLGRGKVRRYAIAACVLGACSLLLLPDTRDRIVTLFGIQSKTVSLAESFESINTRKLLADAAWSEFLKNPLLGVGFGNFPARAKTYSDLITQETAESTFLQILAETGLVGFGAFGLFLWTCWRSLRTGLARAREQPEYELFYIGLAAGYFGYLLNCLFDTNLEDNLPWVLLPLLVFLGGSHDMDAQRD
jgi:O-antigen ligase